MPPDIFRRRPRLSSDPTGPDPDLEWLDAIASVPQLLNDTAEAITRHWDTHQSVRSDRRRVSVMGHIDRLLDLHTCCRIWLTGDTLPR